MHGLISIPVVIVVCTILGMIARPRGLREPVIAAIGAALLLATTSVPLDRLPHIIGETADVMLFLLGMMLLTGIVERAAVFDVVADRVVRLARGNGRLLFVLIYLLGAIITATLSLDVTVIVLTPIVFAVVSRRGIDPLPYMFICAFVANLASLALPVSNLTNLLLYEGLDLDFAGFVRTMWLPNLVAGVVNVAIFLLIFRKRIPHTFERLHLPPAPPNTWLLVCGGCLTLTLAGIVTLGLLDLPIWWAAMTGAAVLLTLALLNGKSSIRQAANDISPSIFVFVIAMSIVVDAFRRAWLDDQGIQLPASLAGSLAVSIGASAIGSNIVNNIPMTVLALGVIDSAANGTRHALAYGTLVGANIGPALTTYGSLATMLWLTQCRRRGIDITTAQYMRISLVTVPPVLVATGLTLWLVLHY